MYLKHTKQFTLKFKHRTMIRLNKPSLTNNWKLTRNLKLLFVMRKLKMKTQDLFFSSDRDRFETSLLVG